MNFKENNKYPKRIISPIIKKFILIILIFSLMSVLSVTISSKVIKKSDSKNNITISNQKTEPTIKNETGTSKIETKIIVDSETVISNPNPGNSETFQENIETETSPVSESTQKENSCKTENTISVNTSISAEDTSEIKKNIEDDNGSLQNNFTLQLLNLLNTARTENGLTKLNLNKQLCIIAQSRSSDMIARDYFSHITPDGKSIFDILKENGIGYKTAGENLIDAFPPSNGSPETFFNTWMSSDTHRANILNNIFTQIGIGTSSNNDKIIGTLVFLG